MSKIERSNLCPVCFSNNNDSNIFLKKNINLKELNIHSFSSRKIPEFMNYELIKCSDCDLIYAINIPDLNHLYGNYSNSIFSSKKQEEEAADTYFKILNKCVKFKNKNKAFEIGSSSGSFLAKLKKLGFKKVRGVEPSYSSINSANEEIKKSLLQGFFENPSLFYGDQDLICCFMTLEHVYNPLAVLDKCYKMLNNNGKLIIVVHNHNYILNRILGKKSPIIDIEHLQLFSEKSIIKALENSKFSKIKTQRIVNSYNLSYWLSLLPLTKTYKKKILSFIKFIKFNNLKISINVGNIMVIANKNDL